MDEAQGYEVQGEDEQERDVLSIAAQAVQDVKREDPSFGFTAKFHGESLMTLSYHSSQVDMPNRQAEAEHEADQRFKAFEKAYKAAYKDICGKAAKLKEDKDQRRESVQKVSLNNRYYYIKTRTYSVA